MVPNKLTHAPVGLNDEWYINLKTTFSSIIAQTDFDKANDFMVWRSSLDTFSIGKLDIACKVWVLLFGY